jgi:hypothetical protein
MICETSNHPLRGLWAHALVTNIHIGPHFSFPMRNRRSALDPAFGGPVYTACTALEAVFPFRMILRPEGPILLGMPGIFILSEGPVYTGYPRIRGTRLYGMHEPVGDRSLHGSTKGAWGYSGALFSEFTKPFTRLDKFGG